MNKHLDYFGRELKEGQKVLHVSRQSSSLILITKLVTKVTENGVWIQRIGNNWYGKPYRNAQVAYTDRLVIAPDD